MKIISIVGARPQFIKLAPLVYQFQNHFPNVEHRIIHTGQHYDYNMSKVFFDQLNIPEPNFHLEIGSGTHGSQTGKMLIQLEAVLLEEKPDWVLIYGDTNSTLAGAVVCAKQHIPLAHIEAGLRSFDKRMPEEINRILADHCSHILFCPTKTAIQNLRKEGFRNLPLGSKLISTAPQKSSTTLTSPLVLNIGDIMLDTLLLSKKVALEKSTIISKLSLESREFYLATIHRAGNTDDPIVLANILTALIQVSQKKTVILPIHPRTAKNLKTLPVQNTSPQLRIIEPLDYLDMINLEMHAKKVITDSGGVQKEAFLLGTPCVTLRSETEWPETLKGGRNILAGTNKNSIVKCVFKPSPDTKSNNPSLSVFGHGQSSRLIIEILQKHKI